MRRNIWKSFLFLPTVSILVTCMTIFVGCATREKSSSSSSSPSLSPILLRLKGTSGKKERSSYFSASNVETHEEGQLVRHREEAVSFLVETRFQDPSSLSTSLSSYFMRTQQDISRLLFQQVQTVEKDGPVHLHELAFPELNETIEMVVQDNGQVLQAGDYPRHSVFFVPSVFFPGHAVQVGDTWTMTHQWVSMASGVPIGVELIFILKSFFNCGKDLCAHIEFSGDASLLFQQYKDRKYSSAHPFGSEIAGHLIFSVTQGTVLATRVANKEFGKTEKTFMRVFSCMTGVLLEGDARPSVQALDLKKESLACEPGNFDPSFNFHP